MHSLTISPIRNSTEELTITNDLFNIHARMVMLENLLKEGLDLDQ